MSNLTVKGNASGTGTVILEAPNTNTNRTITLPDATATLATTADIPSVNPFTLGTAVASTSGTAIDFTGIPSWAKRVTVMLNGVSISGTTTFLMQLGDSGGVETTGYIGSGESNNTYLNPTNGFALSGTTAATQPWYGSLVLTNITGNSWVLSGFISSPTNRVGCSAGSKTLSDSLDRIRITTASGTDTFGAGTINISYEG